MFLRSEDGLAYFNADKVGISCTLATSPYRVVCNTSWISKDLATGFTSVADAEEALDKIVAVLASSASARGYLKVDTGNGYVNLSGVLGFQIDASHQINSDTGSHFGVYATEADAIAAMDALLAPFGTLNVSDLVT